MKTVQQSIDEIKSFNEGKQIGIEIGRKQVFDELIKLYTEKEKAFAKEIEDRYHNEVLKDYWRYK